MLLTTACLALLTPCCGDGAGAPGSCERVAARACELACQCTPASGSSSECCLGSGTGNTRCYSRNMCQVAFTRDLCGDTTKEQALFSGCDQVVEQTKCGAASSGERYSIMPAACDELLECKAGPCLD